MKSLKELQKPFKPTDIEWRIGRSGIRKDDMVWATCLAYISSRAVMDRLDDVVGPENWKVEYYQAGKCTMARLSIKIGGEWVTKEDGSEETDIEPIKGAISGALKRAAVLWGVGRYLYNLEEGFATIVDKGTRGERYAVAKDKSTGKEKAFYWLPPDLPDWALPEEEVVAAKEQPVTKKDAENLVFEMKSKNISMEQMVAHIKVHHQADRIGALNRAQYNETLNWIRGGDK